MSTATRLPPVPPNVPIEARFADKGVTRMVKRCALCSGYSTTSALIDVYLPDSDSWVCYWCTSCIDPVLSEAIDWYDREVSFALNAHDDDKATEATATVFGPEWSAPVTAERLDLASATIARLRHTAVSTYDVPRPQAHDDW